MHIGFLNPQGNFDPRDRYWTSHPDFGGQLVYVKEVALALGALGHQVDILTRRIIDPGWEGFEAVEDAYPSHENVRILRLDCGPRGFLRKEHLWPHLAEWSGNILRHYENESIFPDTWTAHYADGGLAAALLNQARPAVFTFTGHSLGAQKLERLDPSLERLPELQREYHFSERLMAERVAISGSWRIVVSTRQEQYEQYGHPIYHSAIDANDDARFELIPPGVNLRIFDRTTLNPHETRTKMRLEAAIERDLPEGRRGLPTVIVSARLEARKNHIGIVRAFARSEPLKRACNLFLFLSGMDDVFRQADLKTLDLPEEAGRVLSEIQRLAESADLWDVITTISLQSQRELAAAYSYLSTRGSVFCLPALYEPFGLAPLEAMAAGLPVVVTRHGGPSESLREGGQEFGVLIEPTDPDDVARGILRLVSSSAAWQAMAEAGYQRVIDRYTWTRTAEGYARVLEMVQSRPPPRTGMQVPEYLRGPHTGPPPALDRVLLEK